jgi:DNA-binding response OmpR family regulator
MSGERLVLVVDDEPNIRETVGFILEMEGYDVEKAVNGREGLEKIRSLRPRAVLLDAMMPEMDGFEVCRRVKEDPELAGTTIIMLTAMGQDTDRRTAMEIGADHFLTKPFDDEEVLAILSEVYG